MAAGGRVTDVLLVRLLQEEGLERPRRLLHQSLDDFVQVGAGNLEEETEPVSNLLPGDAKKEESILGRLLPGFLHQ